MNTFSIKQTAIREVEQFTGRSIDIADPNHTAMVQWFVKGAVWATENDNLAGARYGAGFIITTVCNYLRISEKLIFEQNRERHLVKARHMIYYLMRQSHFTLTQIAAQFGHHHSTVIHGLQVTKKNITKGGQARSDYNGILAALEAKASK